MITVAEVEKLGRVHVVEPIVLSVYLNVPRYPAGLPGRVDELVTAAVGDAGRPGYLRVQDRHSAREEAALAGLNWAGHPVGIFACAEVGLLETIVLPQVPPGTLPDEAVLGIRPHIRPLLAVLQPGQRLAEQVLAEPAGGLTVTGLPACLAAINAGPVETLVVPRDALIAGYECGRCGALGLAADCCLDWGTATLQVPDLIGEMVTRTLEDGGQVLVTNGALGRIGARRQADGQP